MRRKEESTLPETNMETPKKALETLQSLLKGDYMGFHVSLRECSILAGFTKGPLTDGKYHMGHSQRYGPLLVIDHITAPNG